MARGIGVLTGSSDVVFSVCEDGKIVMGGDVEVSASLSGSLVLELQGTQGDGKFLRSDAVGSASWATVSASEVTVVPFGDVTSSNVQDALQELRNDIADAAGSGSFSVSDGGNTESIPTDGTQTITFTGSFEQITASYDSANNRFTFGLTDSVRIVDDLDVGGDLDVTGNVAIVGNLTVNGTASYLNTNNLLVEDPLILLASGNAGTTLDMGLIMERGGTNNRGFIFDESADEFAVIDTTETGFTSGSVAIADYVPLHVGDLIADDDLTVGGKASITGDLEVTASTRLIDVTASSGVLITGGGIEVTGAVLLPDNSITNAELVNSSWDLTAGTGISASLSTINLGDTLALAVDIGTGSGQVAPGDSTLTISGTLNEINIDGGLSSLIQLGTSSVVTIGLPDDVEIAGNLTVTGNLEVTGGAQLGTDGSDLVQVNGQFRMPVFTTGTVPAAYTSTPADFHGHMFYLTGSGLASGDYFRQGNKVYFNENGDWYPSPFFAC